MPALHTDMRRTVWLAAAGFAGCFAGAMWLQQPLLMMLPVVPLLTVIFMEQLWLGWYALLASLSLSAELQFSNGLGTDIPDEPLMLLLTLAVLAVIISAKEIQAKPLLRHPVFFIVVLQFCWYMVSSAFSTHPLLSVKYLLAKTWYIVPFVVLPCFLLVNKQRFRLMAWSITGTLVPIVLFILWRHSRTGFLFDDINGAVTPFFRNHVNYSAFLVCCIPMVWYARKLTPASRLKNALLVILLVFLAALFFSFSRGAWLALAAGIVAAWCLRKKLLPAAFTGGLLLLLLGVLWFARDNRYLNYHHNYKKTIYHANFTDHMVATFRNQDMSNAERVYRWIAGIRMSGERVSTGFGPNTFYQNYKSYTVSYFRTWVSANAERSTVHNYLLLLLAEQGLPGLLLFIALLLVMLVRLQRVYYRLQDLFYKTVILCAAVVLSMIIVLNLLSDLVETDKIGSLFYLCAGVLVAVETLMRKQDIGKAGAPC